MRHLMITKHPVLTGLSLFILAVFVTIPVSRAQDFATITGVVTDQTGAVIPGVSVTLQSSSTGSAYTTTSNGEGSYTFTEIKPGPGYTLRFVRSGFKTTTITGIYMNVDATRTENAKLSVGTEFQTLEVSAASETVTLNTTDSTVGNNFQVQFLQDLPVEDRDNPSALFYQQPGVTLDGSVTGARVDQTNVTVDGMDVNDNMTGCFGCIVGNAPVDSVQEFRGVTAGPLSSAGQGSGAQFELVTRSGTNSFHGALVEYHRDTDLEANDWFNNNTTPITPRPPLIRNQFGGNIGGPIKRNKLFFFFDLDSRRDTLSSLAERTVPMASLRNGEVSYCNETSTGYPCNISTLSGAQVAALDPQGVGFNSSLLSLFTSRYPTPNDFSGVAGDLVNTAGLRFNAPFPLTENVYVQRVDYTLNDKMKIFGRGTFDRINDTTGAIQFPGDPQTFPHTDQSYGWVAGHTWTIGSNIVNQATYGETFESLNWPNTYNPEGITQWGSLGGNGSGGTILSGPYASAVNAQGRSFAIPELRDDFTWLKGKHGFTFGGTFKWEHPNGYTILDYNTPGIGLGGYMSGLNPTLRPNDIWTDPGSLDYYDSAFALALGNFASTGATFNYNAQGNILPQGSGSRANDRYDETELYFGDTWKLTSKLTISYGLRWQNYTVPYEINGIESVPTLDFEQYFGDRLAQSAAGQSGNSALPLVNYVLGGKANNGPGFFKPVWKNYAPRFAFAWSPYANGKTVLSGGGGVIYDHTVVNSILYQADQYTYLFEASSNIPYGTPNDANASLMNDPRFSGLNNPVPPPTAPAAISAPYAPFSQAFCTIYGESPCGLIEGGAFNESADKNLKTPYSIGYDFGLQQELPGNFLLKITYVGRLGRRLLAQADANQLIDFADNTGRSNQLYSQAMAGMHTQLVQNAGLGPVGAIDSLSPQPWFEDMLPGYENFINSEYAPYGLSVSNTTQAVALGAYPYPQRGDFADMTQSLAASEFLPPNVGMGSQFSEFTYYTNKGFSGYNGMLVTLHKNLSGGVQFDLNYTWAHSIDNVSIPAINVAFGGYGFICDVNRPRECRGNSDFDVANYLNGNFIWQMPFGRGQALGANIPFWANEIIGGWEVSGLPSWHTGNAYFITANAFVAGYANDAPAILTGNINDLKAKVHKDANGIVWAYQSESAPINDFTGPIGFQIGARNNLRGPGYFDLDLGLGKTFPIYKEKVNLKFRTDAFNALNHPSFSAPGNPSGDNFCSIDITESCGVFGVISSTVGSPASDIASRVLQGSLRLEF